MYGGLEYGVKDLLEIVHELREENRVLEEDRIIQKAIHRNVTHTVTKLRRIVAKLTSKKRVVDCKVEPML